MTSEVARPLDAETLDAIRPPVVTPGYDRRRLRPAIIHLGVGGFHRAHQAVYLDDLAARGGDWGERGVGLLSQDRGMAEALAPQQGLYTVLIRSAEEDRARVIGSLLEFLLAPDQPQAVLDTLAGATTRLVTLTITEG